MCIRVLYCVHMSPVRTVGIYEYTIPLVMYMILVLCTVNRNLMIQFPVKTQHFKFSTCVPAGSHSKLEQELQRKDPTSH